MGDDPSILEEETARAITKMQYVFVFVIMCACGLITNILICYCRAEFEQNKQSVISMMGQHAVRVQIRVPEARKA